MKLNWGYSIILFFVVFCSLMIAFVVFSLRQNNDLVTDDYYEKGADFTRQMEINRRSLIYKDSIQLSDQSGAIVVRFAESICQKGDTMLIYFYRASGKRFDYTFTTKLNSNGINISKTNLTKGRYAITFRWLLERESYQIEKEIYLE